MTASKYDVFIAYRRPEGAAAARLVEAALSSPGVYSFLDLSDLCRGHFEFPLLKRVAATPNFLVVLTPGALDRCSENGDWLKQEISQAIKTSRNVIPLVMPGFEFPKDLTGQLGRLPQHERVECSATLAPEAVAEIVKRIREGNRRQRRRAQGRMLVAGLIAAAVVAAGLLGTKLLPAGGTLGFGFLDAGRNPAVIVAAAPAGVVEASLAGVQSTADELVPPRQRIAYVCLRSPDRARVVYRLPYLDTVREGGAAIQGLACERPAFSGEVPELVVKVSNGTERTVGLSTAVLKIDFSKIVADDIPVFDDMSPGGLRITNQGWARIELPTLRFSITSDDEEVPVFASEIHTLTLPTIADSKTILLGEYLSARLNKDLVVRVAGTMQYGEPGNRRSINFSTRVRNGEPPSAPVATSMGYHAFIRAGHNEPVVVDLESAIELKPGETATFLIRVRTDKTSTTRMSVDFTTTEGTTIHGEPFLLDLFVPRFQNVEWKHEAVKRQ